jgi:hypothetical protein
MRSDIINSNSASYGGENLGIVKVPDAATYTMLAEDSGKIHVMPDLTADCTLSFPAEEVGLVFEFWYGGTAADAQDWTFDTGSNTNFFVGGAVQHDTDNAGDDTAVVDSNGSSNSIMGVLTPIAGTRVKFVCDGLKWYVNGTVVSATDTGITFADQS